MYRVVLDANQIVSAFIKKVGHPAQILDLFARGLFEVVTTPSIIKEIEIVLNYPRLQRYHRKTKQEISHFLSLYRDLCINVSVEMQKEVIVKDDPTDDKYLICAVVGNADYVITGDKHLLNISSYKDVKIITPREFFGILK